MNLLELKTGLVHADGPDGIDYTLCGLTAEKIVASRKDWHPEDETELIPALMRTNRVTCWYCANTIRHCVSLGAKAICRVREGGDHA